MILASLSVTNAHKRSRKGLKRSCNVQVRMLKNAIERLCTQKERVVMSWSREGFGYGTLTDCMTVSKRFSSNKIGQKRS